MKVIDLLNKIANGEVEENKEYLFYGSDYCTIRDFFNRYIVDKENLNLKVETLGEDKKIEKLDQTLNRSDIGEDFYRYIMENRFKINKIIDELNKGE